MSDRHSKISHVAGLARTRMHVAVANFRDSSSGDSSRSRRSSNESGQFKIGGSFNELRQRANATLEKCRGSPQYNENDGNADPEKNKMVNALMNTLFASCTGHGQTSCGQGRSNNDFENSRRGVKTNQQSYTGRQGQQSRTRSKTSMSQSSQDEGHNLNLKDAKAVFMTQNDNVQRETSKQKHHMPQIDESVRAKTHDYFNQGSHRKPLPVPKKQLSEQFQATSKGLMVDEVSSTIISADDALAKGIDFDDGISELSAYTLNEMVELDSHKKQTMATLRNQARESLKPRVSALNDEQGIGLPQNKRTKEGNSKGSTTTSISDSEEDLKLLVDHARKVQVMVQSRDFEKTQTKVENKKETKGKSEQETFHNQNSTSIINTTGVEKSFEKARMVAKTNLSDLEKSENAFGNFGKSSKTAPSIAKKKKGLTRNNFFNKNKGKTKDYFKYDDETEDSTKSPYSGPQFAEI